MQSFFSATFLWPMGKWQGGGCFLRPMPELALPARRFPPPRPPQGGPDRSSALDALSLDVWQNCAFTSLLGYREVCALACCSKALLALMTNELIWRELFTASKNLPALSTITHWREAFKERCAPRVRSTGAQLGPSSPACARAHLLPPAPVCAPARSPRRPTRAQHAGGRALADGLDGSLEGQLEVVRVALHELARAAPHRYALPHAARLPCDVQRAAARAFPRARRRSRDRPRVTQRTRPRAYPPAAPRRPRRRRGRASGRGRATACPSWLRVVGARAARGRGGVRGRFLGGRAARHGGRARRHARDARRRRRRLGAAAF